MSLVAYPYVGPEEIRRAAASQPEGQLIACAADAAAWLARNPDAAEEGATYIVDVLGRLRLAPRRSEHVACAGGQEVLAAGELRMTRDGTAVVEISNQSTGYCPDATCWDAVSRSLAAAGLRAPPRFTHELTFRHCPACGQLNVVKERWFVCAFCSAELPSHWNVASLRSSPQSPSAPAGSSAGGPARRRRAAGRGSSRR